MTIQQIEYILEVYRAGSISAAAARLYVAQANLSSTIRAVEQDLGFPIFVRTGKGVEPTEKGLEVLSHAGEIIENYNRLRQVGRQETPNRFRLSGLSYSPACDAYVELCREYQDSGPLEFSYTLDELTGALDKLYLSMRDLIVCMQAPQTQELFLRQCAEKSLRVTRIAEIPIVLRIGPKHPLYNEPEIHLSDFQDYTFVDYNSHIFRDYPNLDRVISVNPARTVTVTDRSTKNLLISETAMYGLGSKLTAETNARYRFRSIPLGDLHYDLLAIERKSTKRSELAQRYLDILSGLLQDL